MTDKHSIVATRRNLSRLIREAENGKTVKVTRHGEPVAVLIGYQLFERLIIGRSAFIHTYEDFTKTVDLSELALDPDVLFEGLRDTVQRPDVRY